MAPNDVGVLSVSVHSSIHYAASRPFLPTSPYMNTISTCSWNEYQAIVLTQCLTHSICNTHNPHCKSWETCQCHLPWKLCISGHKVMWTFMLHFQSGIIPWSLSVDWKLILYSGFEDIWPSLFTKYRVIQILCAHTDGCCSRPWLVCWPASGPLYSRCFQTLTLLFHSFYQ